MTQHVDEVAREIRAVEPVLIGPALSHECARAAMRAVVK